MFLFFVVVVVVVLNAYVTMNFSELPGINALKTKLSMLVEGQRKYHCSTVILFVYLLPPELKVAKR